MTSQRQLRFVTLLGSLRKDSVHAAIARALPSLAPEGITIASAGSIRELPHYDADLQMEGFPPALLAIAAEIQEADAVIIVTPLRVAR